MPPGPELAYLLAGIDPAQVAKDIIDVLTARSRQLAHDQAHLFTTLSEVRCRGSSSPATMAPPAPGPETQPAPRVRVP